MISSINNNNVFQFQPNFGNETKMTDDQKSTLQSIIANYDPKNMTKDDMKSMMDEIIATGITPSKEFGEIMNAAGFEKPEKPGGDHPPMGPPPQGKLQNQQSAQLISDYLAKQEEGTATEEDMNNLIKALQKNGEDMQGLFINQFS